MLFYTFVLVALQCTHFTHAAVQHKRSADGDKKIIFPGPIKEYPNKRYGSDKDNEIQVPPECQGKTFCTIKPENYPEERFNQLFKGYSKVHQPTLIDLDLDNRQSDSDDRDDCMTEVTYDPLYMVVSSTGQMRTVVQAPQENYLQRVRLETCKNPDANCFKKFPSIPGITTYCKQTTNTWQVVVEKPGGGTEKIETELPVCCSCHYR